MIVRMKKDFDEPPLEDAEDESFDSLLLDLELDIVMLKDFPPELKCNL